MSLKVEETAMMRWVRARIRFLRSHLGVVFLVVIGTAVALFTINYVSGSSMRLAKTESGAFDGRKLSGWDGDGDNDQHHHRRRKSRHHYAKGQICRVPLLSLKSDANKDGYHSMPPLKCRAQELFFQHEDGTLLLNETVLRGRELVKCEYRSINFLSDHYHTYSKSHLREEKPFELKIKHDFFRVECYLPDTKTKNSARKILQYHGGDYAKAKGIDSRYSENEVERHKPRLTGSVGLPDLPDSVLREQAESYKVPAVAMNSQFKGTREQRKSPEHFEKPLRLDSPQGVVERGKDLRSKDGAGDGEGQVGPENVKRNVPETQKVVGDRDEEKEEVPEVELKGNDPDPHHGQFDSVQDGDAAEDYQDAGDYADAPLPDFDQFVAQVYPKEEVMERVLQIKAAAKSLQMNVLIFALDSMSHLSYQRKLPKTYHYLKTILDATILKGYNIVGDATTAALIPILTGHSETELPEVRVNKENTNFVDVYPLIWNKFEQSGYTTLYAEDQPSLGSFQLRMNGFEQPPVDHYMRPFWQAALASTLHEGSPQYCLGRRPEHRYTLDYVKSFFVRYSRIPKFAFGFLGELSHADNNPVEYIDDDLVEFLQWMKKSGNLDNTLLIVMGDHGARYSKVRRTVQGKLEERLPMMSLTFPGWFRAKYRPLADNLKKNSRLLTTPFDVHETLKSLLRFNNETHHQVDHESRGISLLAKIPVNRTCASAGIALHWCTCLQMEEVDTRDKKVTIVADEVVKHINSQTQERKALRDKCSELSLKTIEDSKLVYPNEMVLRYQKSIDPDQRIANFSKEYKLDLLYYQIIITTSPNDAVYEATVQVSTLDASHKIVGEVSRINAYGDQPACIVKKYPEVRKYCYCRNSEKQT